MIQEKDSISNKFNNSSNLEIKGSLNNNDVLFLEKNNNFKDFNNHNIENKNNKNILLNNNSENYKKIPNYDSGNKLYYNTAKEKFRTNFVENLSKEKENVIDITSSNYNNNQIQSNYNNLNNTTGKSRSLHIIPQENYDKLSHSNSPPQSIKNQIENNFHPKDLNYVKDNNNKNNIKIITNQNILSTEINNYKNNNYEQNENINKNIYEDTKENNLNSENNTNINNNAIFTFSNQIYTPKSNEENFNQYFNNKNNQNLLNFINDPNQEYYQLELKLKKPISSFKLENNIKFFYQVNKGEISEATLWTPFDEEDCILLELHYPNYLIGGPCEVILEKLNKIVNFKYMMLVDIENPENHIHIKRSLPNKLDNIIRKHRFNFENYLSLEQLKNRIIPNINILKDYNKYSEYLVSFEFNLIRNHNFEVKIPKHFEYLYKECIRKSNYGGFVVSLREEIEILRRFYNKENSIYLNYLDNLENSPRFFQIIIQMFTEDGYLSREINKVLRKPNLEKLNKIKYFYLALLVSLSYCSINVRPKVNNIGTLKINNYQEYNINENENLIKTEESNFVYNNNNLSQKNLVFPRNKNTENNFSENLEKNLLIYRPYKLSGAELDFYKENIYSILFSDEFISATPNKEKAENYFKAFNGFSNDDDFNNYKNFKSLKNENNENNQKRENSTVENEINLNNNFSYDPNLNALFEIEVPYYMLENDNLNIDSLAFVYDENFSLYPQDEEIILRSGSILMVKEIIQTPKELHKYVIKMAVLSFSWKGFFDCLAYNQNTKEINLNKNGIGNFRKSVKYLCEALVKNKNIEKLDLKENNFGENFESMKYLANLLSVSNQFSQNKNLNSFIIENAVPMLKILDLNNNKIGKNSQIAKVFCEALQININLKHLDLSCNFFNEPESAKALSQAIMYNKSIEKLDLSQNNLGSNLLSVNYISEAILYNKKIQVLNLSDNNIGERPDVIKSLFDSIAKNKILRKLNLSNNSFGVNSISVRYLAESLILNQFIQDLDLKNNSLGNVDSLTYLCALLEKNDIIEVLDLSKNKIGINRESYTLLGEALSKNRNLHTINLSSNNLNTHLDYLRYLLDSIVLNNRLKRIFLSYNSLSNNVDFKEFARAIQKDRNINYIGANEF